MGFSFRKSFRAGPVRLNLSKRGIGASIGGRGARIGISSAGRGYVGGGSHGIYYRSALGTTKGRSSTSRSEAGFSNGVGFGPAIHREDTGVTYRIPLIAMPDRSFRSRLMEDIPHAGYFALASLVGLAVLAFAVFSTPPAENRVIFIVLGSIGFLGGGILTPLVHRYQKAINRFDITLHDLLEPCQPLNAAGVESLRSLMNDPNLFRATKKSHAGLAYLQVIDKVIADRVVSDDERQLLQQIEDAFGLGPEFYRDARVDVFRAAYIAAVADQELTPEEEHELVAILVELEISEEAVLNELSTLQRLRIIRQIRQGELPVVHPKTPLATGETCHFEGPARIVKEKVLKTFQADGQRHKVTGLVVDKEGTLLVTDKRLLMVHLGTTTIDLKKILEVELDMEQGLVRLTRDGVSAPTLITTPEAPTVAAIVASLVHA